MALKRPNGNDVIVERLGVGQYFGEISLLNKGRTVAAVRAVPEQPVEALALDGESFQSLLAESTDFRAAMQGVAQERVLHNQASLERI